MLKVGIAKQIGVSSDVKSDVVSDVQSDVAPTSLNTSLNCTTPKSILVQIPQGIKLSDLPNPFIKNKRRGSDAYAYFVSLFVTKNQYKYRSITEWTPISSTAIKEVLGYNYHEYIQALIDAELIEEYTNPYSYTDSKGEVRHCKGSYVSLTKQEREAGLTGSVKKYRLKENTPLVEYVIQDKLIIRKINKARIEKLERLIKNNPTAKQVYESIKLLSIDVEAATDSVRELYNYHGLRRYVKKFIQRHSAKDLKSLILEVTRNRKNKKRVNKLLNSYGIIAEAKAPGSDVTWSDFVLGAVSLYSKLKPRMHWIRVLDEIQKGKHSYISMSEDKRTGRIFNTLTLTPKNIRKYMKLDGKPLIEFDAANCQWQLLQKVCNILCNASFNKDFINKYTINNPYNTTYTHHTTTNQPPSFNMLQYFFNTYKKEVQLDCRRLEALLKRGLLREYIIGAYSKQGQQITDGQAKTYLIKYVLFGNPDHNNYQNWTSVKAFRTLFPHIYQVLIKLKKYWLDEAAFGYRPYDKDGATKYKALPMLLQKMESEIFIGGMRGVDVPFITLHDAVITNKDGEVRVKKALESAIKRTNSNLKLKHKEL